MERQDTQYPPFDECWYDHILLSQFGTEHKAAEWTFYENKLFENAIAELEPGSPAFFEKVASSIPWKTLDQIETHYHALVEDVEMIESGFYSIPDYPIKVDDEIEQSLEFKEAVCKQDEGSPSYERNAKTTSNGQQRKRGVPWTEQEHHLFLLGLQRFGKGDWRSISRYYVISRTPTQVASHAQKYFKRQTSSTPMDRRRPSIHDIQTVHPTYPTTFTNTGLPVQWNGNSGADIPYIADQLNPFLH